MFLTPVVLGLLVVVHSFLSAAPAAMGFRLHALNARDGCDSGIIRLVITIRASNIGAE